MVTTDAMHAAAHALAAQGFRVIPLRARGKVPLVDDWPRRATTDGDVIDLWWQRAHAGANVGIATGEGLLVLDLDGEDAITRHLPELERTICPLPETRSVTTASGVHLYFHVPCYVPNSVAALAPGVDVRADGGQVVAPPSVHASGHVYAWQDTGPVADLPQPWVERILGAAPAHRTISADLEPGELIGEGERNDRLFRIAAKWRGQGMSVEEIATSLHALNAARCRPALAAVEVEAIITSVARYEPGEPTPVVTRSPHSRPLTASHSDAEDEPRRVQVPPFPEHVLPPAAASMAVAAAKSVGVPVGMTGVAALVAMSAALGATRHLDLNSTWRARGNLWAAVVAPPSSGKTPSSEAMLRPLRDWQDERMAEYSAERQRYEQLQAEYEATKPADRGDAPVEPTARRLLLDDVTNERLYELLAENPRGVLLLKDELSAFVRGMNQYKAGGKGSDRSALLAMWNGTNITVDRKIGKVTTYVPRPHVCVFGGIQPGIVGELASEPDGLMERFLLSYHPASTMPRWSDDAVTPWVQQAWAQQLHALLALSQVSTETGYMSQPVHWTKAARTAWVEAYNALADEGRTAPAHVAALYGKYPAHAARLAMVLHLAACTADGYPDEPLTEQAMTAAWELVAYFKAHARAAYVSVLRASDADKAALELERWLERQGGSATLRLMLRNDVFADRNAAEAAINRLCALGVATKAETGAGRNYSVKVTLKETT